jgi:hypothetical protein
MDASKSPSERADRRIGAMTLDQKIAQLHVEHSYRPSPMILH